MTAPVPSPYDRILVDASRLLHLSPASLRHANLVLLLACALIVGVALTKGFHRAAGKHAARWAGLVFAILAVLPIPTLLMAAVYIDLHVLMLTVHGPHVRLLQRAAGALAIGVSYYIPTRILVLFLRRWGSRRSGREKLTKLFAFLIEAVAVMVAVYTLLEALRLAPRHEHFAERLMMSIAVFLGCYGAGKLVTLYLARLSEQDPSFVRFTEPAVFVARALFGLVAIMIVLDNLGVRLTAIWTTLGVGSVAVAMALQETLSNFFAGLYLLTDRPVRAGDYIQLDSGQEGNVLRIGWRSTSLRSSPAGNLVVIPNSAMAKAVITNFSHPERQMLLPLEIGVAYGSDPRQICRVLKEIVEEAVQDAVPGIDPNAQPRVNFLPGFGDSSLNFTLMVGINDYSDQFRVQTELRTRIVERFAMEGIEFPFPTRTLVLDKSVPEVLGMLSRSRDRV